MSIKVLARPLSNSYQCAPSSSQLKKEKDRLESENLNLLELAKRAQEKETKEWNEYFNNNIFKPKDEKINVPEPMEEDFVDPSPEEFIVCGYKDDWDTEDDCCEQEEQGYTVDNFSDLSEDEIISYDDNNQCNYSERESSDSEEELFREKFISICFQILIIGLPGIGKANHTRVPMLAN